MLKNSRLLEYVNAEPFQRFRIKMTSGEVFEIRHPEMVQVGRHSATIFLGMSPDHDEALERQKEISLMLVESVETASPAAKS